MSDFFRCGYGKVPINVQVFIFCYSTHSMSIFIFVRHGEAI